MKEINIAEQPWLSLKRTVKITIDGIRYRLFRATVTVAVIVVAVAFLMNILAESLIKRAVAADTRERSDNAQLNSNWSTKLTATGSPESIVAELARLDATADVNVETRNFIRLADDDFARLQDTARDVQYVLDFFDDLDYAKRRDLIKTAAGLEILDYLARPENFDTFKLGLDRYRMIRFEMDFDKLQKLIAERAVFRKTLDDIIAKRHEANAKITAFLKAEYRDNPTLVNDADRLAMAMTNADGKFGDVIRSAGFNFDPQRIAPIVADQAKNQQFILRMKFSITGASNKTRQLLAQEANKIPSDINEAIMWDYLESASFAKRYIQVMQESGMDTTDLTPELLVKLAKARKETAALARAKRLTMDSGKGFMGLGERLAYLLVVSFLVCGIGITNAMMMSVTERFTEIATLKCLGALDGFIMIMFVLESCIMGIVGGTIGAVIGAVIGTGRMMASFGVNFFAAIPVLDIFGGIFISILLGTLLAAFAAVVPSFKAARLAPMEAMRVE